MVHMVQSKMSQLKKRNKEFEVNIFGLARITLVLPHMRAQQSGHIINISSMGGRLTTYFGAWYHATKYALEALAMLYEWK